MNESFFRKHEKSLKQIGIFALSIVLIYFIATRFLSYVAPFLIAWILSQFIDPMVRFLQSKARFPRWLATLVAMFIGLGIIGLAGTGIVMRIIKESIHFAQDLPAHIQSAQVVIEKWAGKTQNFYIALPDSIQDMLKNNVQNIVTSLSKAVGPGVGKGSISIVAFIPNFFIFFIITLVSLFFFSHDKEKINTFVYKQLPDSWLSTYGLLKKSMTGALFGYVKAQLTLMTFIIMICIIGLTIVGYEYALFLGFVIGCLDALPLIGTGGILIPWAIWKGITGDIPYAIGLAVTYASVVVLRQILEPKIVGHHIGIYPLVTLISMYVGVKTLGFIGIILGPVFIIMIKTLQEVNLLPQWKR
ncbi:MAG: sporulation integral membrane protein YtvI [Epulopiscium sp.]|nr:sporulation integral membrane protein YtvI [Candidatus Epulonipiscium sp.]